MFLELIYLVFVLVFCRWGIEMPAIIAKSISILSDAGLGMAMFSLGMLSLNNINLRRCLVNNILCREISSCNGNLQVCLWHYSLESLHVGTRSLHLLWLFGS